MEAIEKAQKGQINVRMISGDNLLTAKAVAIECKILAPEEQEQKHVCMTGEEFRSEVGGLHTVEDKNGRMKQEVINKQNFKHIANRLRVLARATPEDKHIFVVGMRDLDCAVAVTGEGINDIHALRAANVGLTMGSACEIAKDASDIILMDDNFSSSVSSVMWGRNIFQNIRKFLQFQLTVNVSCLSIVLLCCLIFGESPFSVIQLLWINLIMDTLAALALATEPPHPTALKGRPVRVYDKMLSQVMWRQILGVAAYEFLVMTFLLLLGPLIFGYQYNFVGYDHFTGDVANDKAHVYTIMFNTFVFMNIFNFLNCRKLGIQEKNIFENPFNNLLFWIIFAGCIALQVVFINYGGKIMRTTPLTTVECIVTIVLGACTLGVAFGLKSSPTDLVEKIPVKFDEDDDKCENDAVMGAFRRMTQKAPKKTQPIN